MRRGVLAGALCMLLLVCGCGAADQPAPDQPAAPGAGADGAARAAAQRFLDGYVDGDGRVVRRDQGGDTVSEGQSYALLLAAATGDEARMDRVWTWTKANLQRPDGLLSSRWADGRVADEQAATDADLDAAQALVDGGRRMHRADLRREGVRIARAVLAHETVPRGGEHMLVAGPWAARDGVVNPSYFAPRAYAVLSAETGSDAWSSLRRTGDAALRSLVAGGRLPPDWARADDTSVRAAARADGPAGGGDVRYGFDAVRVPIRMATACNASSRAIAAQLWPRLKVGDAALIPRELGGNAAREAVRHPVGLVGAAAAAHAAGDTDAARRMLERAERRERRSPTYYGAAWVALGRVLLTTDLLGDCPPAGG